MTLLTKWAIAAIVVAVVVAVGLAKGSYETVWIVFLPGVLIVAIGTILLGVGSLTKADDSVVRVGLLVGGIGATMIGHVGLVVGGLGGILFGGALTAMGVVMTLVGIGVIEKEPESPSP